MMVTLHTSPRPALHALLPLSLLLACTPLPKHLGDELGDSDADDPTGTIETDDGESVDPDAPQWSHIELGTETLVAPISALPDGGVVAIEHHFEPYGQRVIRYASDGSELWRVDVGSHWLYGLVVLPDGRLVVGGTVDDSSLRPATWRLSAAGLVEATYVHPLPGEDDRSGTYVNEIVLTDSGLAYLVHNSGSELPSRELWAVDFDLQPQWSYTAFEGQPDALAVLPSGELCALGQHPSQADADLIEVLTSDGTPAWDDVVNLGSHFAEGDPLVLVEFDDDADTLRLHGLYGTSPFDVVLPSPPSAGGRAVSHGNGVAAVGSVDFGHLLSVLQFDPDGALVRELELPPLADTLVAPAAVEVAPDGSLYISGFELGEAAGAPLHGFILKLPPPA